MNRPWNRVVGCLSQLALLAACGCGSLDPSGDGSDLTVYMTPEEALGTVFPGTARVVEETAVLSAKERQEVEAILENRVGERAFRVHAGIKPDGSFDGFAVIHEEIGKFKPFEFIVGVNPDGTVRRVAVLVYREARGGEIAHRRFLSQYPGKSASDPIHLNRDIINISGATMSVSSLNYGIKKVLAVIETVYRRQPERLGKLLSSATLSHVARSGPRQAEAAPAEVRGARYVMGSICEIQAFGQDRSSLRQALDRAFGEIEAADRALSDWRSDSELNAVSRASGSDFVPVSRLTASFFELAKRISVETDGAFDITVGPLVRAWGFRGKRPGPVRAPSAEDLEIVRSLLGHDRLELSRGDYGALQARLRTAGMVLDPGALGKGFAVDLAVRSLERDGVGSALVNFSGNMYALGSPPGEAAWTVAVRDPAHPDSVLGTVSLRDAAISSSGGYEKWVEIDGVRHSHILSPFTLQPVDETLGATVVAPGAALADGYSTAACVLGEKAILFLESRPGVSGIVALAGAKGGARFLSTSGWMSQ